MNATAPEPVRLVVWDLDETFWHGTLSEGGMRYRHDVHDIVVTLAQRGIVSSICSKNDMDAVRAILEAEGIWEYFIFPSINWDAKGPRLAALVEDVQLRAPTILFIDDNPMNLAEAQHYVPGIQVANDTIIADLLASPLLRGKPDSALSRLKQYQLLQRRRGDEAQAAAVTGDNTAFLRESGIVVTIEHDLEPHLDRAIELINRTNQLNFTKLRLPEDPEAARAALRETLSAYATQAGILRVRDRYGDYGYCGLYVVTGGLMGRRLIHFCFSCRILNMGVETWLYRRLEQPKLRVAGEVLTDVHADKRDIDWITMELPGTPAPAAGAAHALDYVYVRGACDMRAVTHYFTMVADTVQGDFNEVENGAMLGLHHSVFARHALEGVLPAALPAFAALGYREPHFRNNVPSLKPGGKAIWVMSFWADPALAIYAHKGTGLAVPAPVTRGVRKLADLTLLEPGEGNAEPEVVAALRRDFTYLGRIDEDQYKQNLRTVCRHAPPDVRVFFILANETKTVEGGGAKGLRRIKEFNQWTAEVAAEFACVDVLRISDFVAPGEQGDNPSHFTRMVYFKLFQEIMRRAVPPDVSLAAA